MEPMLLARLRRVSEPAYSTRPGDAAQHPPQLVHHREVGAAGRDLLVGQGGGRVDYRGDVDADGGGVEVDGPRGGLVEDAGQAADSQKVKGEDQIGRTVVESRLRIGASSRAFGVGRLLEHLQDVGNRGLATLVMRALLLDDCAATVRAPPQAGSYSMAAC
jgi:hypothetical protein